MTGPQGRRSVLVDRRTECAPDRWDITAASEVMATLVLARDYADLRHRLGQIVIGASVEGHPIKAEDLEA